MTTAIKRLESCIAEVKTWMTQNQLKLNDEKTELILVSSPHHKQFVNNFPGLLIGDSVITPKSSVRNLGAIFDSLMSMEPHINNTCKLAYYHLRNINSVRHCLSKAATETLIHALISSKLDYGNALLYNTTEKSLGKIQRVQNSAARVIARVKLRDHIKPVLKDLHWLPVKYRIIFKILILTFKAIHQQGPLYIQHLVHQYHPARNLRSGSDTRLTIPRTRMKSFGDRSFTYAAAALWNSLPGHVRNQTLFTTFKSSVKTYLFNQAF